MVAETPSPEIVGREFIVQYYTLLHEAPRYMHRFYNNLSTFVHGGVGEERPPAVGQAEIHRRIMEIKFENCHTKIRHVDSQTTVNNAVVVQVSGELSNNNEAPRRFMQTFVLAAQSPNKYYVHNDIFRYQDEIFCDTDTESSNQEEGVTVTAAEEPVTIHYEPEPAKVAVEEPAPLANGDANHVEHSVPDAILPEVAPPVAEPLPVKTAAPQAHEVVETALQQDAEPKNKTWSAIASKKGAVPAPQPQNTPRPAAAPVARPAEPPVTEATPSGQPQRAPRPPRDRPESEKPVGTSPEAVAVPEKKPVIPDSCQIFVGNLPTDIDTNALKDFFGSYGPVIDVKIFTSSTSKVPYGFVAFSDEQPVKAVLSEKRVEYKGHRVNVEEKKQKGFIHNGGFHQRGRYVGSNYRGGFRHHVARGGPPNHDGGHSDGAVPNRAPAGTGAPKKA